MKDPQKLVGQKLVHIKTGGLYVVTGAYLNVTSDKWCVSYDRYDEILRGRFGFTRDLDQFTDGRFLHVK